MNECSVRERKMFGLDKMFQTTTPSNPFFAPFTFYIVVALYAYRENGKLYCQTHSLTHTQSIQW